jgi:membrane protein DedA with SNARE-associated domain
MPLWRFTALTAIGSLIWNAGLIAVGEALAARWAEVAGAVAPASAGLLAAVVAAVPLVWCFRRRARVGIVAR